jgi:hypothetical protein
MKIGHSVQRAAQRLRLGSPKAREYDSETLDYMRRHDAAANASSKLPEGESLSLSCLWMFEAYTAVEIDRFVAALSAHQWLQTEWQRDPTPAEWVRSTRENVLGGAWINIAAITRERRLGSQQGPLPSGVDAAMLHVWTVTPSLTILGVMFAVSQHVSRELSAVINRDFATTELRVGRHGTTYVNVEQHKSTETWRIREQLRDGCSRWLDTYFPGVFSGVQRPPLLRSRFKRPTKHPAAEAWEIGMAEPFGQHESKSLEPTFLDVLGLAEGWNAWELLRHGFPKMRLATDHDDPRMMAIATNAQILAATPQSPLKEYSTLRGATIWLGEALSRLVVVLLLRHYWTALTAIRDSVFSSRAKTTTAREIVRLRTLQQELSKVSHIVPQLTVELVALCDHDPDWNDLGEFIQVRPLGKREPAKLLAWVRGAWKEEATRLRDFAKDVAESASAAGTLLGAQASDRVARMALRLQWATLGAALLALLASGVSLWLAVG